MTAVSDAQCTALSAWALGMLLCLAEGQFSAGAALSAAAGALTAARHWRFRRRPTHQRRILAARHQRLLESLPGAVAFALLASAALGSSPSLGWTLMTVTVLTVALPASAERGYWTRKVT